MSRTLGRSLASAPVHHGRAPQAQPIVVSPHVCAPHRAHRRAAELTARTGSTRGVVRAQVVVQSGSDTAVHQASTTSTSKSVPKSSVWEIDFCSRPLLDERGKKVWELLICDPERNFEFSQYFPNSKINSAEVGRLGCRGSCTC